MRHLILGLILAASVCLIPYASADQKCVPGDISPDGYHCVCSDPNDPESCGWNDPCPGTSGPNPDGSCPSTPGGEPTCPPTLTQTMTMSSSPTVPSVAERLARGIVAPQPAALLCPVI